MPRTCTVCHSTPERRNQADMGLSDGQRSLRDIARQTGFSKDALVRHKPHVQKSLLKAAEVEQAAAADSVLATIKVHGERIQLLYDACDRYLRDPGHPDRYDLGPRDTDVTVIYETEQDRDGPGDPDDEDDHVSIKRVKIRKKALLSELIAGIPNIFTISYKIADPRELILKTAVVLKGQLEFIGQLSGELMAAKIEVHNTQVNIYEIMPAIFHTLKLFPAADKAVREAVMREVGKPVEKAE